MLITSGQEAALKLSYHPTQKKAESWLALSWTFSVEIWNFQEMTDLKIIQNYLSECLMT